VTQSRPADPSGHYVEGIDGLRAFSVIAVIGFHIFDVSNVHTRILDGGSSGVSVFFVISGFLITSLLLKESTRTGTIRKRAFWTRRAQRLFPSLAAMLIAVVLYNSWSGSPNYTHFTKVGFLSVVGYFGNWYTIATSQFAMGSLTHTWSLAVEEQFYIVWPLVLVLVMLRRRDPKWLLPIIVIGCYVSFLLRVLLWRHGGVSDAVRIYCGSDTNAECILWGCGLAVAARVWPDVVRQFARGAWAGVVVLIALLELPMSYAPSWVLAIRYVLSPTLVGVATCSVIAAVLLNRKVTRPLSARPLTWIGKLSYDLYLWHFPVILALAAAGIRSAPELIVLVSAIVVPISMATARLTREVRHRGHVARSASASPIPLTASGSSPTV
jgi:peptidoglycan/LPS O-acetylase OafA/YrhL